MRILSLTISIFWMGISVSGQSEDSIFIKRISDEILTNGKAYENLHDLTKKIGGRLSGSPQMVKAEQWGLQLMRETGADKAWLQECMVPHWVRGGMDEASFKFMDKAFQGKNTLDVLALGNSMGTGSNGVRAEVLMVNSFDELEAKKDQVKGKIVFYNYKFNATFVN